MNKKLIVSLVVAGFSLSLILAYIFAGQYLRRLSRVNNIYFENNYLSWDIVDNSSHFNIVINGVKFETEENLIEYQTDQPIVLFEIQAVSSFNRLLNSRWRRIEFVRLPDVERIWINDGILRWDKVENADSYDLIINDELLNVKENHFTLTSGEELNVRIRAIRNNRGANKFFSHFSNAFEAQILEVPVISFDQAQTRISWGYIENSTGYKIRIILNGAIILEENIRNNFLIHDFLKVGSYYIYVQALAEGDTSFFSSAFSSHFIVKRLSPPSLLHLVEENDDELRFLIESLETNRFEIIIDGLRFESGSEFLLNNLEAAELQIEIFGASNDSGTLNSLTSTIFTFQRNASPTELRIINDILYWDSSALSFMIKTGKQIFFTDNQFFSLRNISENSSEIKVRALSNGTNTLASAFSEILTFTKLSAPENIFINNFMLSWSSEAENFIVLINEREIPINAHQYLIQKTDLRAVMEIRVIALGNGKTIVSSSESEVWRAYQLTTPILENNNDMLFWDEDTNRLNTYIVHNANFFNIGDNYWSFSNIEAGSHTFRIMSLGDNSRYFDSAISETLVINKLMTPVITTKSDRFLWADSEHGFELTVDGNSFFVGNNFYIPKFRSGGIKQITVQALGNNGNVISSKPYTIAHEVKELELRIDNFLVFSRIGTNLLISLNRQVNNAINHELLLNGTVSAVFDFTYALSVISGQSLQVSFRAIGDRMHFADSEISISQTVQILEDTEDLSLHFIAEDFFHLRWEQVDDAAGYEIIVIKYDALGRLISDNSNNPVIQGDAVLAIDMTDVSRLVIMIRSRSNQAGFYDSNFYLREFRL
ncbi:MAG: hypothetical protein FWE36_06645 [Erysipelotrichales bacterium]|nr:hypothetical protein [Erysipelotrichales bacterium]